MCKDVKDGGYKGARDRHGRVWFSLTTIRTYWPNWLKKMSNDDMNMCACETCQNMDDLHAGMVGKRRKIIARFDAKLEEMGQNTRATRSGAQEKELLEKDLAEYKLATFVLEEGQPKKPVHDAGWDACEQYGCGARRYLTGHEYNFLPWCCKKGDCAACDEQGYTPPSFETKRILDHEMIKFSIFERKAICTVPGHGGHHVQKFDDNPKLRCTGCEDMEAREPGWKKKNKAKVVERKARQVFHIPLKDYVGPDGVYAKAMKKMRAHKQDVILLGKKMNSEPRHEYVRSRDGKAVLFTRDFMERMGLDANNQMQFEYFNKSVSLGSEGITVYIRWPGKTNFETVYYPVLSTESSQDGRVVYSNTALVLNKVGKEIEKAREGGAEIGALYTNIEELLDVTDGCAESYRCGSALFMLWKLAKERNITFDRALDASGHGKKLIDGFGGMLKNFLQKELRGNVTNQHETIVDDKNTIIYVDLDQTGNKVDFSDVAAQAWNNRNLDGKVPANRPRRQEEHSDNKVASSLALVRKNGVVKFDGLKMEVKLNGHGLGKDSRNNGIRSMYHVRFEKALKDLFVCRHVPCFCPWCVAQLKKATPEERYNEPGTGCVLWPIMEIFDEDGKSTGRGYNDWRYGEFVQRKDSDNTQFHAALRDMNIKTGERYSNDVIEGNIGAYMVSDPQTPVYLVEWKGGPWMAEEDGEENVDGHVYRWRKGDYLCRGNWLDKLAGARNWYTWDAAGRECIVKLDQVVNANVDMRSFTNEGGGNPLPTMPGISKKRAEDNGAWRMSDDDSLFLVEEVCLREDNFEYDIAVANKALQQEREEQRWSTVHHQGEDSEEGDE